MECLQIRRHVYGYARSLKDANPIHLEVSCVLHELGCVGFAQQCYSKAKEMFSLEREILVKLEEAVTNNTAHPLRIHQARLTNLTWLRKVSHFVLIHNASLFTDPFFCISSFFSVHKSLVMTITCKCCQVKSLP